MFLVRNQRVLRATGARAIALMVVKLTNTHA
jgi:hypothetical protein